MTIIDGLRRMIAAVICLCAAVGCGYGLVEGGGALPEDADHITIALFSNETGQAGAGAVVTEALRGRFLASRRLRLTDREDAELVLTGRVTQVRVGPAAFSSSFITIREEVFVEIETQLVLAGTGEVVWQGGTMSETRAFYAPPESMTREDNKDEAIEKAAAELAERIVGSILF